MSAWTIRKRIILGFSVILVLSAILAVVTDLMLRQVKKETAFMQTEAMPGLALMSQIKSDADDINMKVLRVLMVKNVDDRKKLREEVAALRVEILKYTDQYEKTIASSEDRQLFGQLAEAREKYVSVRNHLFELCDANKPDEAMAYNSSQVDPAYDSYQAVIDKMALSRQTKAGTSTAQTARIVDYAIRTTHILSLVVLISGAVFAWIIVGRLNRVLARVAAALNEGTEQVTQAAGQVSASSQSLAEGSSEQAASIEETSSSLEEMASMTKRNAENAQQANVLAQQARAAADKGVEDMKAMSSAMETIKASSDDIAKIIKTIDEIAFQTNILALNAAVEAARAGEAGMGFAVVADEVRNLAQRSAQAAKETAAKIEGAITNTAQGAEINGKVAQALNEIVTKAREVDSLAAEVANASREQTQGITQINAAVGQMDKVIQGNTANAEESAAAAEQLNAQAHSMRDSVGELLLLVGARVPHAATPTTPRGIHRREPHQLLSSFSSSKNGRQPTLSALPRQTSAVPAEIKARSEIPLEEGFKDF